MRYRKNGAISYLSLVAGAFLTAAPFPLFLIPNDIAPGGLSGIGTLLHALTGVPVGAMTALLNAPLFLIGWRRMGRAFAARSLAAMLLTSVLTDLLPFGPVTQDPMLAAIFGGVCVGVGLGLVIRGNATTGGTDMAALLIHERFPILTVGGVLLGLDFCVIASSGFVFGVQSMMYALICVFVTSTVMDRVVEGLESAKAIFVFSHHTKAIVDAILHRMQRGATLLHAKGAYSGEERDVLLSVVTRLQIPQFKSLVKEIDPDAFLMITDVREAMGEGFTRASTSPEE